MIARICLLPRLCGIAAAAVLTLAPQPASAEFEGDITAYTDCVIMLLTEHADNFMAPMIVPIICGERHIPIRQSCGFAGYLLPDERERCWTEDLALWQAEVATRDEAALSEVREVVGSLHSAGLERCLEEYGDGPDRVSCETKTYWGTTMYFLLADAQEEAE